MTTLNPATRLSSPELAVTRAGPPLRVRLPAGGWQVGFRAQHDGRTVIEVTGQYGSLAGLVASSRRPTLHGGPLRRRSDNTDRAAEAGHDAAGTVVTRGGRRNVGWRCLRASRRAIPTARPVAPQGPTRRWRPGNRRARPGLMPGVPWWGMVSAAVAPVLLISGWTFAAGLQRGTYNAVADTVSALAAEGAADRWVMTLAFLLAGAFEVVTGLSLRPAAAAGRLILMAGGVAGLLVAASPEPAGGGGSVRHMSVAAAGLVALAVWPAAARRPGPSVPWGLRPAVSAGASAVLLAVLLWFGAELLTSGGQAGLAERLLGGLQTLWPVLVILSCRLSRPGTQPPGRPGNQVSPGRTASMPRAGTVQLR